MFTKVNIMARTKEKTWFGYSKQELSDMFLVIIVLGFCFSFRNWGSKTFDFGIGIANLILTTILVAIALSIHMWFNRYIAKRFSAKIRFVTWRTVLLISIFLCFLTNGWFVFAAVWAIQINATLFYRPKHRRAHMGPFERAKVGAAGPAINILLAIISAGIAFSTGSYIFSKFMFINIWIAGMHLFPFFRFGIAILLGWMSYAEKDRKSGSIAYGLSRYLRRLFYEKPGQVPYMEGEIIFFGSKSLWAFMFSFFVALLGFLYLTRMAILSTIFAFIVGFVVYVLWHWTFEHWYKWGAKHSNPNQEARINKNASKWYKKHPEAKRKSWLYD